MTTMRDYVHPTLQNNSSKAMATSATTTTTATPNNSDNESSDREVKPKFIVGNKKYGRKSRPRENEELSSHSDSDNETVNVVPSSQTVVDDDTSQKVSDIYILF
jgi:hypothetical protein